MAVIKFRWANKFSSAFSVEHFDAFHSDIRYRVIVLTKKQTKQEAELSLKKRNARTTLPQNS